MTTEELLAKLPHVTPYAALKCAALSLSLAHEHEQLLKQGRKVSDSEMPDVLVGASLLHILQWSRANSVDLTELFTEVIKRYENP